MLQHYVALFVFWLLTLAKRLIELMLGVFEFFMHLIKLAWVGFGNYYLLFQRMPLIKILIQSERQKSSVLFSKKLE